jgi:ABC-2 type transport system permease protein
MVAPMLISKIESGTEKIIAVIDSSSIFDYTKILKEVTALNSKQLYNEVAELNPKAINERQIFTEMSDRMHAVVIQRDENMVTHLQTTLKSGINKLQDKGILTNNQADSIIHRHSEYYSLLIKEFESVKGKIPDETTTKFIYTDISFEQARQMLVAGGYYAIVFIPQNVVNSQQIQIISKKSLGLNILSYIQNNIERAVENQKMIEVGISMQDLSRIKTKIKTQAIRITDDGQEKANRPELAMIIGYASGFVIYFVIFMFGSLVMRGVIEEKSNRIVEVILSSVKPHQLLAGKIIGVGLVGITQFALWMVLTFALVQGAAGFLDNPNDIQTAMQQQSTTQLLMQGEMQTIQPVEEIMTSSLVSEMFKSIESINIPLVLGMFLFYFLSGFLLYAALFAAIGAAVDNEADTQQFMLPITIPLIIGMIVMFSVVQNPESTIAYWFSIIPFTSPIVMMTRIPFGVPVIDVLISVALMIVTIAGTIWLSAKIYKTGILMYGSKIGYKDLWKWLKQ